MIVGPFFFIIYYLVFKTYLTKKNLSIDVADEDSEEETETAGTASIGNKQLAQALEIIEGLGGKDNIKVVNNCLTRLRVDVKDMSAVDEPRLKKTGAMASFTQAMFTFRLFTDRRLRKSLQMCVRH